MAVHHYSLQIPVISKAADVDERVTVDDQEICELARVDRSGYIAATH
jgi:hypothetical protein